MEKESRDNPRSGEIVRSSTSPWRSRLASVKAPVARLTSITGGSIAALKIPPVFGITAILVPIPLFIVTIIALWFGLEWALLLRSKGTGGGSVIDAMLADIELHYAEGRHYAILRLRDSFSRFLWVEGRLAERIRLGEAAEAAAAMVGDTAAQIAALIDDLGWTLVAAKEFGKAKQHLSHGLKLATNAGEHYWIAKARRHLAGLAILEQRFEDANNLLELATTDSSNIDNVKQRTEMLAGIEYARATAALLKGDFAQAEAAAARSEELRSKVGDKSRVVRTYALKAKIALARNDFAEAKDLFRKGLVEAEAIGRRDEQVRNHLGLFRVYKHGDNASDLRQAQFHRAKAEEMMKQTPVPYEIIDTI